MSTYIIYETLCLVNLKIYVGQHCTSVEDGYLGSGKSIKNAIKKYGKKNFVRETIEFCTSANVNEREDFWIDKLSATDRNIGYNLAKFSKCPMKGRSLSEKSKDRLRKLFKGKPKSEEHKRKLRENHANFDGKNNPMFGHRRTKEEKENQSMKMKGRKLSEEHRNKLKQIRSSEIFRNKVKNDHLKYIWTFISPKGQIFENIIDCKEFCNQNNLGYSGVIKSVNLYKTNKYKNWKIFNKPKE